ncbi:acetolactate synthase [Blattabacterium cuenoti]|uniref:acetolactate synthase n=1 Tax=Blattabacterium cuenoti TaxID=1653831 RepID=UPI001EEA67FA|nr:acetolactate synthase [Blattabacterium cuenoti]
MIILGENQIRLLSRMLVILNRKNLKISHINVSNHITKKNNGVNNNESIDNNTHQYVIDLECNEEQLIKVTKSIEKLIGIIHVYFFKKKENKPREKSWKEIDFPLATF